MVRYLFLLLITVFFACSEREIVQISNSGEFKAFLSIEDSDEGYGIWVVNIVNIQSDEGARIEMENYPGSLMAYIAWDEVDRLWFYSSDDGSYYYWHTEEEDWETVFWDATASSDIAPPSELLEQMNRSRRN